MEKPYYDFLRRFEKIKGYRRFHWNNEKTNKNVAVYVEGRAVWQMPIVVRNFLHFLGEGWDLAIFHTAYNEGYVNACFEDWDIQKYQVDTPKITVESYNGLLKNPEFWNVSDAENVLLFQSDCIACKPFDKEWFQYDLIGAPCGLNASTFNGGLSLRRRKKMLEAIEKYQWMLTDPQEDVWFSKAMRMMDADLPNGYDAARFSVESWYYELPFGVHGTDKCYHDLGIAQKIVDQITLC